MHDDQNGKPPPRDAIPVLRSEWEGGGYARGPGRLTADLAGHPGGLAGDPPGFASGCAAPSNLLLDGEDRRLWIAAARAAIAADTVTVRKAESALDARAPTRSSSDT